MWTVIDDRRFINSCYKTDANQSRTPCQCVLAKTIGMMNLLSTFGKGRMWHGRGSVCNVSTQPEYGAKLPSFLAHHCVLAKGRSNDAVILTSYLHFRNTILHQPQLKEPSTPSILQRLERSCVRKRCNERRRRVCAGEQSFAVDKEEWHSSNPSTRPLPCFQLCG
jgi:hypothetical protein